ncbi:hypothetical protein [Patulibacter defluvii]|uniref:hypothetical protein n=1 Tax=Patulibacter defluvii TaxID=3095358 RepID=UPI002A766934|nr:hypothetical protein [Patulibacter sp. DM4]
MVPLAHVAGLPVEELLPALYGATGVVAVLRLRALALLPGRRRRRPAAPRRSGPDRPPPPDA